MDNWEKREDGVYRDGELIAVFNVNGVPVIAKDKENLKSAVTRFLNGIKADVSPEVPAQEREQIAPEVINEKPEVKTNATMPPPPAMDPLLGSKSPEFQAWREKYNPSYEELCEFMPELKKSERKIKK